MIRTTYFIVLGPLLVAGIGCSRAAPPLDLPESQRIRDVVDALDRAYGESDSVPFRSWNGKWIGTDCDTEIVLHRDGRVSLTEFGYGVDDYEGRFTIESDATITLDLKDYGSDWPRMSLYKDESSLLLIPADGKAGFLFGDRAGATVPNDAGTFWPMRQLPPAEAFPRKAAGNNSSP
jgi:hypothetical protein